MEKTFGDMVRDERERQGLSQQELAGLANTTQASIDRIERNVVERSRSAPEVAAALGIAFPLSKKSKGLATTQAVTAPVDKGALVGVPDLPIYTAVRAGAIDDSVLVNPDPIDYVKRPEPLAKAKNGYGLYILGDSMFPAYKHGDLALIHPNLPATAGDEVVVCSQDVNGEHYAVIKLLVRATADKWHLKQYNPPEGEPAEFTLDRREWPICHLVVGNYRKR